MKFIQDLHSTQPHNKMLWTILSYLLTPWQMVHLSLPHNVMSDAFNALESFFRRHVRLEKQCIVHHWVLWYIWPMVATCMFPWWLHVHSHGGYMCGHFNWHVVIEVINTGVCVRVWIFIPPSSPSLCTQAVNYFATGDGDMVTRMEETEKLSATLPAER